MALSNADFALSNAALALSNADSALSNGVLANEDGVVANEDGVVANEDGVLANEDGVVANEGGGNKFKICSCVEGINAITPPRQETNGQGMPHYYDTPGLCFDSGATYDYGPPQPQQKAKHMAKAKLALSTLDPNEVVELANQIIAAMTGNANFTTPVPTLAALTTLITNAQTALDAYTVSLADTEEKLSARDDAFTALCAGLTQEAGYVEAASGGDKTKIESAGMAVRADRTPPQVPGQVMNLALTEGDFPGTLDAAWDPDAHSRVYEQQTSPDPMTEASWVMNGSSTRSRKTIEGLTSGSKVWVRVRAVGPGGAGPWSDPAVKTVP